MAFYSYRCESLKPQKNKRMNISELNDKISKITFDSKVALVNYYNHKMDMIVHPVMTHEFDSKFRVWFATDASAPLARNICFSDNVVVSYTDYPHNQFVSLTGMASLCRDEEEKNKHIIHTNKNSLLKKFSDKVWLICFEPEKIEFWDYNNELYVQYLKFGATTVLHAEKELKSLSRSEFAQC